MNIRFQPFSIAEPERFKEKMLSWATRFNIFCFLDNQQYRLPHQQYEMVLAAGARRIFVEAAGQALDRFSEFERQSGGWLFGHLAYDLKNEIEKLSSRHPDYLGFADLAFFEPEYLLLAEKGSAQVQIGVPENSAQGAEEALFHTILQVPLSAEMPVARSPVTLESRVSRDEYGRVIHRLKEHIRRGDCYEINYCLEWYADKISLSPLALFRRMSAASPNPFSAFYRWNDSWLVCASPERYLRRQDNRLLSQPIKGTGPRMPEDEAADDRLAQQLKQSRKERSENVMIVDLVRNDLSRVCEEGSVRVSELFGVQRFPQVHHLVSTIEGILPARQRLPDVLRASFPMGSMTGAPKKRVMELIDRYESFRRGLFSGSLGYRSPSGDFDFNVVIRSFLYNARSGYLSYPVGSGITFYSDPEKEYEECLWKASAIKKVLA